MAVMTGTELAARCRDVAENYKTLYVMGAFGAPLNDKNKARYCDNHSYNRKATRQKMIKAATADTFGFDCVNLIKGVCWGWIGDLSKTYGGAKYATNGVPDTNADGMIKICDDVTTDFSHVEVGEAVWCQGHIGVYIGDGLAVEATPKWANCVQITACNRSVKGYKRRNWTKHGKLPFITYENTKTEGETVNIELPVLKKGTKGAEVKTLQRILLALGYDLKGYGADGSYGKATEMAVRAFQGDRRLTVDGICGAVTWTEILCNS